MDKNRKLLSDIVVHTKYARFVNNRREGWKEIVDRTFDMHRQLLLPTGVILEKDPMMIEKLEEAKELVLNKLVMPSMRSLQFSGDPILAKNERLYNCSYLPIQSFDDIKDLFTLCMVGCGVGFSVFESIPITTPHGRQHVHVVEDSVEGWCESIYLLLGKYQAGINYTFDFSAIRPEGSLIKSIGSFAPGGHVLERAHNLITEILDRALIGGHPAVLRTIDLFDICCILGDTATCGGTRRSALIAFFHHCDGLMLNAKRGSFWETHPYRSRANISATFNRSEQGFKSKLLDHYIYYLGSETGEPGVFITNKHGWFSNPCCEISLRPYSFCNLTSINAAECLKQDALFNKACRVASFLGTIQSLYTEFNLVNQQFSKNAIRERLLGVSMTGLSAHDLGLCKQLIYEGSLHCYLENVEIAKRLGINIAHRITCVKPEGSTSAVMGTASGVHPEESAYYIRNIRISKGRGLVNYLKEIGYPFMETDIYNNSDMVVGIPIKAIGSTNKQKSASDLIDDIAILNQKWIDPGHSKGANKHNVSTTLRIKDGEIKKLAKKLVDNAHNYTAVAYLPASDVVYPQAPFQAIDQKKYEKAVAAMPDVDLSKVVETFIGNEYDSACSGDKCEISK